MGIFGIFVLKIYQPDRKLIKWEYIYIYIYSDKVSQYINLMRKPNNGFVDTNVSY